MTATTRSHPQDDDSVSTPGFLIAEVPAPIGTSATRGDTDIRSAKEVDRVIPNVHGEAITEPPHASSSQGLDRPYTTIDKREYRIRRAVVYWCLAILTFLIVTPIFVPDRQAYCWMAATEILVLVGAFAGLKSMGVKIVAAQDHN
ncbi:hypothetical protein P0W64_21235 [Tsukamurella sp. 8F]|uniref:hypothetical protein n=1 Tax=unclassified Tsukamurella TaxID=2633480 RepID=UPI0023B8F3B2|nr:MULTISPECIES: hypothetical protein [unclassified Tsukamurella]MDF0532282.1 hypothetical protein [Tsukamurella sp. 8J]MDF0589308.1 hypothetical protein [Tsukamurella sp. 8F]